MTLLISTFLTVSLTASAEDTEIFSNEAPPTPPNLLLILDNSGSMTTIVDGSTDTRMEALGSAVETFVGNTDIENINIGLMAFSNGDSTPRPHGISVPISPIDDEITPIMISNLIPSSYYTGDNFGFFTLDDDNLPNPTTDQTVRQYLPDVLAGWTASGGTPIVDAFHEATLYFKGEPPKWGAESAAKVNAAHPSSYTGNYLTTIEKSLGGWKNTCSTATCGLNCIDITAASQCNSGETSCYTGNNCTTEIGEKWETCNLATSDACMASNPDYLVCNEQSNTDCTQTCSGEQDPETGACLGTETESCSTENYSLCKFETDITSCDREKYECDAEIEEEVTTGTAAYNSPITGQCQNNLIILMSDGSPNASADEDETDAVREEIKTLIGRTADCADVDGQVTPVTGTNTLADGRCGPEIAEYLANEDLRDDVDGINTVKTYTVGFAVTGRPEAQAYLESLATSGGGKYYSADNEAELAAAFISALEDSQASSRSFAAPVYTVDSDSLISNSNDIYLPLFQNTAFPGWAGNLKKFKLNADGEIVDRDNVLAFDDLGSLKPTAIDYWMPVGAVAPTEGDSIVDGGFANNLVPSTRVLKTDDGASFTNLNDAGVSKAALGDAAMTDAEKAELLSYIRGYEADGTTPRSAIGDILHSKPTFISYGASKKVLFFGTNEGFLHAIDAADASDTGTGGKEKFAYMPSSLLKNIAGLKENTVMPDGGLTRIYGVDGTIVAFITDTNNNGSVDTADGDTATLLFGLRRGGNEYYALDVSNPDSPSLKWKISGDDTGFGKLGETWSKPKPAKLRYIKSGATDSVLADVLVFGGGYDNRLDEEDPTARTNLSTTKGNSVFIVDLETGDLIWSTDDAAGTKPDHSIPGDIRTLDMDGDGSIDRLYFGDTGGNIWRADLTAYDNDNGNTRYDIANNAQINHFANLGGSGTDKRMFFFEPDVSVFRSEGKEALILSIGSGYRAHPLNEGISDRFYVLNDVNVYDVPATTLAPLTDSNLVEASTLAGASFFPAQKGWYKDLTNGTGEKVLASPITFLSKIAFTTFAVGETTSTVDENGCSIAGTNIARTYVLDLLTADATVDLDGNGVIDEDDEGIIIENGNILDTPQLVFNEPTNCTVDGCDQFVDLRVGTKSTPIIDKDTVGANNNMGDFINKIYWLSK
ncbi:PilC/PilY family type IV pilus protein [Leucothrix arctica]|nr:PilC/PilY family type IV pilus protein [Leucothrix arctica]